MTQYYWCRFHYWDMALKYIHHYLWSGPKCQQLYNMIMTMHGWHHINVLMGVLVCIWSLPLLNSMKKNVQTILDLLTAIAVFALPALCTFTDIRPITVMASTIVFTWRQQTFINVWKDFICRVNKFHRLNWSTKEFVRFISFLFANVFKVCVISQTNLTNASHKIPLLQRIKWLIIASWCVLCFADLKHLTKHYIW